MTLAMFAIIVLTLVYMSEISFMFSGRADAISKNLSGGFGVELLSNPSDPVTADELAALPGVRRVAPLRIRERRVHHAATQAHRVARDRHRAGARGRATEAARPRQLPDRPRRMGGGRARSPTSRSSTTTSSRPRVVRRRRRPSSETGS